MNNIDKLAAALGEWLQPIVLQVLPQIHIPAESFIGRLMQGYLGIDLSSYNLLDELSFLAKPTIDTLLRPRIAEMLKGIDDVAIPGIVDRYTEAFLSQAKEKGAVNLFGIQFEPQAFANLREILDRTFVK